jgi:hypothetical protein
LLLGAVTAAQALTLKPVDGPSVEVTASELGAMPHQSVTVRDPNGAAHTYKGVALATLLARIGAPAGAAIRGPAMAVGVLVTAADGYRVVLTLPETDPAFRDEKVILADSEDGRPLDAHEGPLRLIYEGDKRPARWARGVTTIVLVAVR